MNSSLNGADTWKCRPFFQTLGDGSFLFDPLRCQRKQSNKKEPNCSTIIAHNCSKLTQSSFVEKKCEKMCPKACRFQKLFVTL